MAAPLKWIRKPLDEAKQKLVEKYYAFTRYYAAKMWRSYHRPARDYDEIQSIALCALVDFAARYDPEVMPPFDKILTSCLKWCIMNWIKKENKHTSQLKLVPIIKGSGEGIEPIVNEDLKWETRHIKTQAISIIVDEVLTDKEKQSVKLRFGLDDEEEQEYKSCTEISEDLGISVNASRSRSLSAIRKIRKTIEGIPDIFDLPEEELREILAYGTNRKCCNGD